MTKMMRRLRKKSLILSKRKLPRCFLPVWLARPLVLLVVLPLEVCSVLLSVVLLAVLFLVLQVVFLQSLKNSKTGFLVQKIMKALSVIKLKNSSMSMESS